MQSKGSWGGILKVWEVFAKTTMCECPLTNERQYAISSRLYCFWFLCRFAVLRHIKRVYL